MKLFEFFGKPTNYKTEKSEDNKIDQNHLFEFILEHDLLYKEYFVPLALEITENLEKNKLNKEEVVEKFMPMVKKGCLEFYNKHKLQGKVGKLFNEELRKGMCEKLYDHYLENIKNKQYNLGF